MIEEVSPGRNTVRGGCIQPAVRGAEVGSVGQDLGNGEEGRIWRRVECGKRIVVPDHWRGGSEVLIQEGLVVFGRGRSCEFWSRSILSERE